MPHLGGPSSSIIRDPRAVTLPPLLVSDLPVVNYTDRRVFTWNFAFGGGLSQNRLTTELPASSILRSLLIASDRLLDATNDLNVIIFTRGQNTSSNTLPADATIIIPSSSGGFASPNLKVMPLQMAMWIPVNVRLPAYRHYLGWHVTHTASITSQLLFGMIVDT